MPGGDAAALGVYLDVVDAVVEHVRAAARSRTPAGGGREPEDGDSVPGHDAGASDDIDDGAVAAFDVPGGLAAVGERDPRVALEPWAGQPEARLPRPRPAERVHDHDAVRARRSDLAGDVAGAAQLEDLGGAVGVVVQPLLLEPAGAREAAERAVFLDGAVGVLVDQMQGRVGVLDLLRRVVDPRALAVAHGGRREHARDPIEPALLRDRQELGHRRERLPDRQTAMRGALPRRVVQPRPGRRPTRRDRASCAPGSGWRRRRPRRRTPRPGRAGGVGTPSARSTRDEVGEVAGRRVEVVRDHPHELLVWVGGRARRSVPSAPPPRARAAARAGPRGSRPRCTRRAPARRGRRRGHRDRSGGRAPRRSAVRVSGSGRAPRRGARRRRRRAQSATTTRTRERHRGRRCAARSRAAVRVSGPHPCCGRVARCRRTRSAPPHRARSPRPNPRGSPRRGARHRRASGPRRSRR